MLFFCFTAWGLQKTFEISWWHLKEAFNVSSHTGYIVEWCLFNEVCSRDATYLEYYKWFTKYSYLMPSTWYSCNTQAGDESHIQLFNNKWYWIYINICNNKTISTAYFTENEVLLNRSVDSMFSTAFYDRWEYIVYSNMLLFKNEDDNTYFFIHEGIRYETFLTFNGAITVPSRLNMRTDQAGDNSFFYYSGVNVRMVTNTAIWDEIAWEQTVIFTWSTNIVGIKSYISPFDNDLVYLSIRLDNEDVQTRMYSKPSHAQPWGDDLGVLFDDKYITYIDYDDDYAYFVKEDIDVGGGLTDNYYLDIVNTFYSWSVLVHEYAEREHTIYTTYWTWEVLDDVEMENPNIDPCDVWDRELYIFSWWWTAKNNWFILNNFTPDPYWWDLYFDVWFHWTYWTGASETGSTLPPFEKTTKIIGSWNYWLGFYNSIDYPYHTAIWNYTATWYYIYCEELMEIWSFDYYINTAELPAWIEDFEEWKYYEWDVDLDWLLSIDEYYKWIMHSIKELFFWIWQIFQAIKIFLSELLKIWDTEKREFLTWSSDWWWLWSQFMEALETHSEEDSYMLRLMNFLKWAGLLMVLVIWITTFILIRKD